MADLYTRLDDILTDKFFEDAGEVLDYSLDKELEDLHEHVCDDSNAAWELLEEAGHEREDYRDRENIHEIANALACKGYDHIVCRLIRVHRVAVKLKGLKING